MPAIIKCPDDLKQSIINDLTAMPAEDEDEIDFLDEEVDLSLVYQMIDIDCDGNDVSIRETPEGLDIHFPIGEVYGPIWDYAYAVADLFAELKRKYPGIGIRGECFAYETNCAGTTGPIFYCEPKDDSLRIVGKWQRCAVCGKILENDTFYNSDQWDGGEGNENCLCSRKCMRAYINNGPSHLEYHEGLHEYVQTEIINPNNSWSEEQAEAYYNGELSMEEFFEQMLANTEPDGGKTIESEKSTNIEA